MISHLSLRYPTHVSRKKSIINLFDYGDYRVYLKDLYVALKRSNRAFSFRSFARRAGFHSPNFLKLVMDGKRNLTDKSLPLFVKGLNLNKQEEEFFSHLVFYNQATTKDEASHYYKQLHQCQKFRQMRQLETNEFEYCSEWHHAAVRELVLSPQFDGTAEWLARKIYPPITPTAARRSIELLEKLGFIEKGKDGHWRQTSALVSTGAEVMSVALFNYHMQMLDLAKLSLRRVPETRRDISSLTVGISKEKIAEFKTKIQMFRQDILKFVATDVVPDTVIQLNIQMFPLSLGAEGDL